MTDDEQQQQDLLVQASAAVASSMFPSLVLMTLLLSPLIAAHPDRRTRSSRAEQSRSGRASGRTAAERGREESARQPRCFVDSHARRQSVTVERASE